MVQMYESRCFIYKAGQKPFSVIMPSCHPPSGLWPCSCNGIVLVKVVCSYVCCFNVLDFAILVYMLNFYSNIWYYIFFLGRFARFVKSVESKILKSLLYTHAAYSSPRVTRSYCFIIYLQVKSCCIWKIRFPARHLVPKMQFLMCRGQ